MGSSLFARHYSGSRGFFPFLWVLRCFSSPACLCVPYVFRHEYHRITSGGFPHSEIPGSKVGQHLTRAYRSRPRPSSALGAKASTVCPYSLDREELIFATMEFSRCTQAPGPPHREGRLDGRSLKTQQQTFRRGRRDLGEPDVRTTDESPPSTSRAATGVRAPGSLERR